MEIYVAYKDYNWMMEMTEEMIERIAIDLHGTTQVPLGDKTIDFKRPFKRITMADSIREFTGLDIAGMDETALRAACKSIGVEINDTMGKGKIIDEIFGEKCEGHYIQPTFILDYPVEMSPLCKKHRDNPELTERFELMVNGKELCNAYSELNDPIDQLERFQEQLRLSEKGDNEAMFIDMDFVRSLEYGMPPTSGMGIGIDRLAMLMTNSPSIQDVLLFPQMKPEKRAEEDTAEMFAALGIPAEWVEVLRKMNYKKIAQLKELKASKLFNDLCGYNKKNQLGLANPGMDEVTKWIN
jgi:lysyl-tRNA synthetase class 2